MNTTPPAWRHKPTSCVHAANGSRAKSLQPSYTVQAAPRRSRGKHVQANTSCRSRDCRPVYGVGLNDGVRVAFRVVVPRANRVFRCGQANQYGALDRGRSKLD